MNRRTWTFIGATIVLLGVGFIALGQFGQEATVRYVEDILAAPDEHGSGSYTLLGIPQPETVRLAGSQGAIEAANPDYQNRTAHTMSWTDGQGTLWHSTIIVAVYHGDGQTTWTVENQTRAPYTGEERPIQRLLSWSMPGLAVPLDAFDDGDGYTPRMWAYIPDAVGAMEVKPSQFTGRLMQTIPDGTPLPAGAYIWAVDDFVAGCSSKFLPDEQPQTNATGPAPE